MSHLTSSCLKSDALRSWRTAYSVDLRKRVVAGVLAYRGKKTLSASEHDAEARLMWPAKFLGLGATRLVFVDESGFQLKLTPAYAYAPRGERAYGSVPKNRGENTSLLAAI